MCKSERRHFFAIVAFHWFCLLFQCTSANQNSPINQNSSIAINRTIDLCSPSFMLSQDDVINKTCAISNETWKPRFGQSFDMCLLFVVGIYTSSIIVLGVFILRKKLVEFRPSLHICSLVYALRQQEEAEKVPQNTGCMSGISRHFILPMLLCLFHCSFAVAIDSYVFYRTEMGYVLDRSIVYNSLIVDAMLVFLVSGIINMAVLVSCLSRINSKDAMLNMKELAFVLQFIFQDSPMTYLQYFYLEKFTDKQNVLWCVIVKSMVLIISSSRGVWDSVTSRRIYCTRDERLRVNDELVTNTAVFESSISSNKFKGKEELVFTAKHVQDCSLNPELVESEVQISNSESYRILPMTLIHDDDSDEFSTCSIEPENSLSSFTKVSFSNDAAKKLKKDALRRWQILLMLTSFAILFTHVMHLVSACYHYTTATNHIDASCLALFEGKLVQVPLTKNCLNILDAFLLAFIVTAMFLITIVLPLFGLEK